MRQIHLRFTSLLALLLSLLALPATTMAQDEKPIVTFHTSATSFTLVIGASQDGEYFDIDCGYGTEEIQVEQTRLDSANNIKGTIYNGTVSGQGLVRIYGDASKLEYLNASGSKISSMEFADNMGLSILNLEHNELQSLNVNGLKNLQYLYLNDNAFSETSPLNIGPLPKLLVLEMGQIDYVASDFTLQNFPNLVSFDAYHSTGFKQADPQYCPKLQRLSLDMTRVAKLDLSRNPELAVLNVSDTRLQTLDLSHNPKIRELYCSHTSGSINTDVKLSKLDVSGCPELYYLFCAGNNLTELDLTHNTKLFDLSCYNNYLTAIDLSHCPNLYNVNLNNNNMDFATLPADSGQWHEYYYSEHDLGVNPTYKVGDVIDLSNRVLRKGTETNALLYAIPKNNPVGLTALDSTYYSYSEGKLTLLKPVDNKVRIVYANSLLNSYTLSTSAFAVKSVEDFGKDEKALSFSTTASQGSVVKMALGVGGASAEHPVTAKVDFGDGNLTSVAITTETPTKSNVSGRRVSHGDITVWLPQDQALTAFAVDSLPISSINLDNLASLRQLAITHASLYSIDLSYNNKLQKLDLSNNNLSKLSLKGQSYYYLKSMLTDINISNNALDTLSYDNIYAVRSLDISHNHFKDISLKDADNLRYLNAADNQLSMLQLSHSDSIVYLNVADNQLSSIYVPADAPLGYYNISGNQFSLADMPDRFGLDEDHFIYAPQQELSIATSSPGVNLADQLVTINGQSTQFTWKTADGKTLTEGSDYTISAGNTKFLNLNVGKVYCEISHAAYPAFSGENVLRTTFVQPIGMPTVELASFTTVNDGDDVKLSLAAAKDGTSVYFDWKGDGNVTPYTLGTTYRRFTATTKANTKVRVLVANKADKLTVFSMMDATLADADLKNMTDVPAITVANAGLDTLTLPATDNVTELNLSGNNLKAIDLTKYPNLVFLSVNSNRIKDIDLSPCQNLQVAYVANNGLTALKLDNPQLWNLDAGTNQLTSVSLQGVPSLYQVWLNDNRLKAVDVTPCTNLHVLNVSGNRLRFSTLPSSSGLYASNYSYARQDSLEVECANGRVDLSSEAEVDGTPTTFRWFVGLPSLDENNELQGEELVLNDEYTVSGGVTTFKLTDNFDNLVCTMTNERFPNLIQRTAYVKFSPTTGIGVTSQSSSPVVSVRNGTVSISAPGQSVAYFYGVDGRLAAQLRLTHGQGSLQLQPAVYVVRVGSKVGKIAVR